ncbi:hypothetical protein HDV06_002524, partial [Boothiomyces sp. JEL0866]
PERWLEGKNPSNYAYVSFMCGPRICLGKNLAEIQGVFTLVSLLKNFEFVVVDRDAVKSKVSLTLPMKNGLECKNSVTLIKMIFSKESICGAVLVGGISLVIWNTQYDAIGSTKTHPIDIKSLVNNDKFDKAVVLSIPFTPSLLIVNDTSSIEYITASNFDNYVQSDFLKRKFSSLFGNGIFSADGHHWFMQRAIFEKTFTLSLFKNHSRNVFSKFTTLFLTKLNEAAESSSTIDVGTFQKEKNPFETAFKRIKSRIAFGYHLLFNNDHVYNEDVKLFRNFGIKAIKSRKIQANTELYSDEEDPRMQISGRISLVSPQHCDLLSLIIKDTRDHGNLSNSELIDLLIPVLIMGRDCLAEEICWTIYLLEKNPGAKEKFVKEIQEILGDGLSPTISQIKKMPYAYSCFREAVRLYPAVPVQSKMALKDDVLPNGTQIRAGSYILWSPFAIARSEKVWPKCNEFLPERWQTGRKITPYEYPVYSSGPRFCPGKSFAETNAIYVLVSIYQNFDLVVNENNSVGIKNSITLPMKNGLKCHIKSRE